MSRYSMYAILWGGNFDVVSKQISFLCIARNNSIIAIKFSWVGEFNGKNFSTTTRSIILVYSNIEEAHILMSWFKKDVPLKLLHP